ncbi:MAG: metallophosphoesterase family protein [Thainema sp.]
MARFLHLADIHLGFDRYQNKERTKDFFLALRDVLERYAIEAEVDFVLIAGDLFEHRNIQPSVLNQAQLCLRMLQAANIPVIAIEGNHDNRPYGINTSWLRYLSDWGQLILLEPGDVAVGEPFYEPWDGRRGGYIDLDCGVRVIGAYWYGATAPKAIEQIAAAVQELPAHAGTNILMFHHGLEDQIARYAGALRYSELLPLRDVGIDYLALGHIHKNYEMEGWIFNPGSLEANSVEEASYQRGVYLVDVQPQTKTIKATLKQDYYQRPVVRLSLQTRGQETIEDIEQTAIATVEQAVQSGKIPAEPAPVVEFRIQGQVGFERLDLDVRSLQDQLQEKSGALIFLLKYEASSTAYASPLSETADRSQIEREVYLDLLSAHYLYKKQATNLAQGLLELKDRQLSGHSESDLYEFAETLLEPHSD